ncbi:hypothetical protein [Amycolatopsis minnesotensis]|uniref:Uncharacterized protein n=1 Tax=Amycolatopsis minnesotensis TaxID=337894 RepID=A0ABN2SBA3_9PSEU
MNLKSIAKIVTAAAVLAFLFVGAVDPTLVNIGRVLIAVTALAAGVWIGAAHGHRGRDADGEVSA